MVLQTVVLAQMSGNARERGMAKGKEEEVLGAACSSSVTKRNVSAGLLLSGQRKKITDDGTEAFNAFLL